MQTVFLIRHAAVRMPSGGRRYIGVSDLPLSEEGRSDAVRFGELCAESFRKGTLYSSSLLRARETAQCMLRGAGLPETAFRVHSGFDEVNLGDWEMRLQSEIRSSMPEEYKKRGEDLWHYRIPGGETLTEVAKRFEEALCDLCARESGALFVVTHAGAVRAFLATRFPKRFPDFKEISHPSLGVTEVLIRRQEGKETSPQFTFRDMRDTIIM